MEQHTPGNLEPAVGDSVAVRGRKGEVVRKSKSHGKNPYTVFSVKFNENETRNYAGSDLRPVGGTSDEGAGAGQGSVGVNQ